MSEAQETSNTKRTNSLIGAINQTFENMLCCGLVMPVRDDRQIELKNLFVTETLLTGDVGFAIRLSIHINAIKHIASRVFSMGDAHENDYEILNDVFLELDNIVCGTIRSHLDNNDLKFKMERTNFKILFIEENPGVENHDPSLESRYNFSVAEAPIQLYIRYESHDSMERCRGII